MISGRTFVSYLLTLATSAKELEHRVHLNSDCREDLRMWKMFLDQWNCVSLFHETTITVASYMKLYTMHLLGWDLVVSFEGVGSVINDPSDLPNEGDEKLSMAFRKLYPIVIAAILWGEILVYKRIKFYCDYLGTVQIIRKGRSKVNYINKLMRRLAWCSVKYIFCIYAEQLP